MPEENKPKSRKVKVIKYVIALSCLAGALIYLFFGPTAVRQMINLRKAREHNKKLNNLFKNYPEFQNAKAVESTGNGDCIIIQGQLDTWKEANRLRNIVIESRPPVKVIYQLFNKNTGKLIKMYRK
jgi:hypothetical protein